MSDFPDFFRLATHGLDPYPYQVRLANSTCTSRALQVPTGAGKTAATILPWLYRIKNKISGTPRRMAYCLPMRVLVEQTFDEASKWIERTESPVQIAKLMGGDVDQDWEIHPEKPFLLIGTQDMLLSRAVNRGYAMSQFRWPVHFGLLNSDCLWVCDEVQLMKDGLATSTQLSAFRDRFGVFGNCPTIWMSATMDASMLKSVDMAQVPETFELEKEDYAQKGLHDRLHAVKRLSKAPEGCRQPSGLAAFLAEHHKSDTQTIAVVNRVARARETYDELSRIAPEIPCHLLHSRFRPWEKRTWQSLLGERPAGQGRILISTQVVEAGVDISSALLVTDLAPWSSLVQRFGRCNRAGEIANGADIFWVDRPLLAKSKTPDDLTDDLARPYAVEELHDAESRLITLMSATPADLPKYGTTYAPTHVLRQRDLIDLFDTTADLSGYDLDVSRFIRSEQDRDVLIAWREAFPSEKAKNEAPSRDELCAAPIGEVKELLKSARKGRGRFSLRSWNALAGAWQPVDADQLRPGMILIADAASGGYDEKRGWFPESTSPVAPVAAAPGEEQANDDDPLTFPRYTQTLAAHSRRVSDSMHGLVADLSTGIEISQYLDDLAMAALYHDWGKAHSVFQETVNPEHRPEMLAKSKHRGKHRRPYFRHELASALALLQANAPDLVVYLAAAHHGKVRLSIRSLPSEIEPADEAMFARGIWDGDKLPLAQLDGVSTEPVILSLEPMLLGSSENGIRSWMDRMLSLRDRVGVFRLAYLEALIVAADCRASADPKEVLD